MKNKSRITSILKANNLDLLIPDVCAFELSSLGLTTEYDFPLPTNLRLGHLVEKIVSQLIRSSVHFDLLHENVQIKDDHRTVGELDFIIKNLKTEELIHLELAYKFYLYDPTISSTEIINWIGPNRNDSLNEKLEKLKTKQFPLLRSELAKLKFNNIEIDKISQAMCFLVSLFIPYEYQEKFNPIYQKAIKGFYLSLEQFVNLNDSTKKYHLPSKTAWGIDPRDNEIWTDLNEVKHLIANQINERQSVLCWRKSDDEFSAFFIVWW